MDDHAASLARTIGARIKAQRKLRDWTLDQLAAAAGVSRRMVVNVEQGAANPSVGTLLRLGDALGVGLPSLVEPPASREPQVTRRGDGAVLWLGESGGRGVLVAGTDSPEVVALWDWTLAAGERHVSEAHAAGTRELLHVLSGAILVETAGAVFTLGAGDALSFHGDGDHAYVNPHQDPARFSLAVFEPGVGAGHRSEAADA